jgi:DNA invertase Pin-like site-specific DNA recombinase
MGVRTTLARRAPQGAERPESKVIESAIGVYGYSRVSTAEQADEGVSLAAQQQQIIGFAMMKGMTIAERFVERGVSGSLLLAYRPEGARMLAAVGGGDVIVVAKFDRAFRSAAAPSPSAHIIDGLRKAKMPEE